ncbi:hypothetical protein Riv7116_0567 [Rivularia sp. PCC 7116]|uniref:hypothetical protein n=1 Tax=Rivularia sp. PCC 7116 TaxID=373994 RepID=UPI00029ED136|nr:hypothetical protein [Rivularia sp. PCC 7116]AFY53161.1 hypothetical protein Riv7116_0567 [Rivularia sp. PCC 7116]
MTQTVAEKTSIPEKAWRRQTDSPTWWIAFSCGSVILHLLAFWFISSYQLFGSRSANYGSPVPIEFIEISPQKSSSVQPKSKPKSKPVSSKAIKPIVPQNSQSAENLSTVVKPPVFTNDGNAIAFNNQKIEQQLAQQERQQRLLQQQQLAEQQRLLEAEQQRQLAEQLRQRQIKQAELEAQILQQEKLQQRILAQQLRQQEAEQKRQLEIQRQQEAEQKRQLEIQRQQEEEQQRQLEIQRQQEAEQKRQLEIQRQQEEEQQRQLEAQRQQEENNRRLAQQGKLEAEEQRRLATRQQPQNPGDGEKITDKIINQQGQNVKQASTSNQQTPESPVKNNEDEDIPLNQSQETQLNQSGALLTANWDIVPYQPKNDIPENPPKLRENISKNFVIKTSQENNFDPVEFQVYLTIDEEGKVEELFVDPNTLGQKRQQYQIYVDKNLKGKKLFYPATDTDPRTGKQTPRASKSLIRIKIQ